MKQLNNSNLRLNPQTKTKLRKAYQSHKEGKSISAKNSNIENFLENAVRQVAC